jgi:hypothetical protein
MKYSKYILPLLILFIFAACSKKQEQPQQQTANSSVHKVTVEEVQQVNSYTYLKVKENDKEYWMAATSMEAKQGDIFFYETAMEMKNFESKELKKQFDSIYFVDNLSKIPPANAGSNVTAQPQRPALEKQNVAVTQEAGSVTIAQLYSNPNQYEGKLVKVKGKVTKINTGILKRNWIHIQDGTSSGNDFDLTITSNETVNVGDVVVFEGKLALNKDFGYGYSYKLILEDAAVKK